MIIYEQLIFLKVWFVAIRVASSHLVYVIII